MFGELVTLTAILGESVSVSQKLTNVLFLCRLSSFLTSEMSGSRAILPSGMLNMLIRYKWLQSLSGLSKSVHCLNMAALIVGIVTAVAMTFVASFQVSAV